MTPPHDAPRVRAVRRAAPGEGKELPADLRSRMEQAFGAPVPSGVRVHDDAAAHALAAESGARAVTIGHDVGVAPGTFPPSSPADEAVLAHELAHTMQYSGPDGPASGGAAHEAEADRTAGTVLARLAGVATPAPARPRATSGLALHRCDLRPGMGLDTGLWPWQDSESYTLDEYIELWEKQMGRPMTKEERKTLAAGCIGITAKNLGGAPPTDDCFQTFAQAEDRADELEIQNGIRPFIFSKRFWRMGRSFPVDADGKVDMTNDTGQGEVGKVNFDYGWWDEKERTWWHANHCDPVTGSAECRSDPSINGERMKVYQSTLQHFSARNRFDADMQVFCVAYTKLTE